MHIRRLDPAENPADLAAVLPAYSAWESESVPGFPHGANTRLRYAGTDGYQQSTDVFGVFADEHRAEALGLALYVRELTKNLDLAWAELCIPAASRTPAAYDALYRQLARVTAQDGRPRLAITLPESADPAAFAARHNGKLTDTELRSTLDLSTIDRARFAQWAEPSEKNGGYTLVRWRQCPEEYLPSFCRALDAMADRPMGDFAYETSKTAPDRIHFADARAARFEVGRYIVAALDGQGEVAAFHTLAAFPDEPESIEINTTGVTRAHRGHGLGLRLKATAVLWLLEQRPSTRWICTSNNDENTWMLAVNRQLGSQPMQKWPCHEFAVAG